MALARRESGLMVMKYGEFHAEQGRVDALNQSAGKGGVMLGFLKNVPSGLDSLAMMVRFRLIAVVEVVSLRRGFISPIILVSFALAACASFEQRNVPVSSAVDFREYEVYRIDNNRYITIRSRHPCIGGQMDGQIFYYDDSKNVRTLVSFTGGENTGVYRGYYAVRSSSNYVAIPSRSESDVRGGLLHINYSHDGGQTFQWFLLGNDDSHYAVIQNESDLYVTKIDDKDPAGYSDRYDYVLDINQNVDPDDSHYSNTPPALGRYGKPVSRQKIPLSIKSPSGATHWTCPVLPKDEISISK
ncbi:TPA: hypothetical protein QDA99_000288 [Burkholderia vietnamiensis]|nr:hypothetical protein [Burkholderia vietnamiensis]HDR9000791.1 hypothetical protein [Burkholderia vietnamiensis]HDR9128150.1 hypothetical protein [Burkholderia vietnamiensis]